MTDSPNRLLEELSKLFTDTAGAAQGVRQEAETVVRSQSEKFLNMFNLVQREDFEAVKAMAAKALSDNEELKKRIDVLEQQVGKKA